MPSEESNIILKKFILFKKWSAATLENMAGILLRINPGIRARLIFAGVITLIFTAGVLQWSFSYGRLAYDITYDDVSYFLDAYTRIQVFYKQGLGAMLAGLFQNPPHSSWSSLLAFTGFAIFGPSDWVPYLMNGITIFLFLSFLVYILRNVHFVATAVLMVLVLFVPFSFFAVHEFRPDFVVALFTCVFSFLAIESFSPGQNHDKFKLRCAGIVFGFALLSKPSFFAHTIALAIFISILIILSRILSDYRKWRQEKGKVILYILRDFYLPGLVLAFSYYVSTWRDVWDYFWTNTRGANSGIWNFKESYWEVLKMFTVGDAGSFMIAGYLYLFLGIVLLTFFLHLYKRRWKELSFLSGLMTVAAISLGIIVFGRHNNVFFGLTYQIMLCLAACYCLSSLYRNKAIFSLFLTAFILLSVWYIMVSKSLLPVEWYAHKSQLVRKETSANLKIIQAVDCYLKKNNLQASSGEIFVSFAGDVNADSMKWRALQNSLPLKFSHFPTEQDLDAYKNAIAENVFVIVADEDTDGVLRWLPSYAMQKPLLVFLRLQPYMKEILIVQTKKDIDNSFIRIFVNESNLDKMKKAFNVSPPYNVQGFQSPEGPYPQWNLPTVRWGLSPESQIMLPNKLSGNIKLDLSARATPGAKVTVTVNATRVYSHVFSGHSFENISTSFSVNVGDKVVHFKYEGINVPDDKSNRAVLFQNISLRPVQKDRKKTEEKAEFILFPDDLISKGRCQ